MATKKKTKARAKTQVKRVKKVKKPEIKQKIKNKNGSFKLRLSEEDIEKAFTLPSTNVVDVCGTCLIATSLKRHFPGSRVFCFNDEAEIDGKRYILPAATEKLVTDWCHDVRPKPKYYTITPR